MNLASFIRWSVAVFLLAASPLFLQVAGADRSRADFAKAMAKIRENMTEAEVVTILGRPDDIRTERDPGGIRLPNAKEIWCYGTKGHFSFPTLGCVFIDKNGRAQESFGGKGQPPKTELFTEQQLQDLLRLLDHSPPISGHSFNPLPLIQIINTLQPLGRERSLAAIREYLRVSDWFSQCTRAGDGLFPVLLVLFDLPDEFPPSTFAHLGMPAPSGPKNPHLIPRFPIALVDDVPLLLISGYMLAGMATPMEKIVEAFDLHGHFRSRPLMPKNDPLAVLTDLTTSEQWIYADPTVREGDLVSFGAAEDNQREKSMLMEQLLRLIDSVYRLPTDLYGNRLPCGEPPEPAWRKIVGEVTTLSIHWDPQQQLYVFQDGTHLPIPTPKIYQREIWPLEGMGYQEAELVLERRSERWVEAIVDLTKKAGATLKIGTLVVLSTDAAQTPMETFNFADTNGNGGGSIESRSIELNEGASVRAKLTIDGIHTNWSPTLKP
jgi:hypothetical protein